MDNFLTSSSSSSSKPVSSVQVAERRHKRKYDADGNEIEASRQAFVPVARARPSQAGAHADEGKDSDGHDDHDGDVGEDGDEDEEES